MQLWWLWLKAGALCPLPRAVITDPWLLWSTAGYNSICLQGGKKESTEIISSTAVKARGSCGHRHLTKQEFHLFHLRQEAQTQEFQEITLPFRALSAFSICLWNSTGTHTNYNFVVCNLTPNNTMSNTPWTLHSQRRRLEFYLPIYVWPSKINYLGFFWTKLRYSHTLFRFQVTITFIWIASSLNSPWQTWTLSDQWFPWVITLV